MVAVGSLDTREEEKQACRSDGLNAQCPVEVSQEARLDNELDLGEVQGTTEYNCSLYIVCWFQKFYNYRFGDLKFGSL